MHIVRASVDLQRQTSRQLTDNAGMEEKVRASKLLSELGLCSRREADSYIEHGLVTVDGEVVNELGVRAYRHQKN